jgi:hypothetical protein
MFFRLSSAQPQPQNRVRIRCRAAAFPESLCQIICRLRFGIAPATEESKKVRCSSAAFPKLFRSRNSDSSCYNVTPLPKNHCSTSFFNTEYKRLTEGGWEAFGWGRHFYEGRIAV